MPCSIDLSSHCNIYTDKVDLDAGIPQTTHWETVTDLTYISQGALRDKPRLSPEVASRTSGPNGSVDKHGTGTLP